jgi:hypothetical protein
MPTACSLPEEKGNDRRGNYRQRRKWRRAAEIGGTPERLQCRRLISTAKTVTDEAATTSQPLARFLPLLTCTPLKGPGVDWSFAHLPQLNKREHVPPFPERSRRAALRPLSIVGCATTLYAVGCATTLYA